MDKIFLPISKINSCFTSKRSSKNDFELEASSSKMVSPSLNSVINVEENYTTYDDICKYMQAKIKSD